MNETLFFEAILTGYESLDLFLIFLIPMSRKCELLYYD